MLARSHSLAAFTLAVLVACGPAEPAREPERNVLLISLDTLRRDRVGAYNPGQNTTPFLDAFAAKSLRFDQAFTHQAWTLTAHATMLSGLYPSVHGVLDDRALRPAVHTMPELFSEAGYATIGVVPNCTWLNPEFGVSQGFGSYRVLAGNASPKIDSLFSQVDSLDGAPFFAFLHLFDAHSDFDQLPYESEPAYQESYAGWYDGDFDGSLPEHPEWGSASRLLDHLNSESLVIESEEDRAYIRSLYDAGVRSLDDRLQVLIEGLEARGLLENTVIAIVADHGEELYDHGRALHTTQFDELMHIPFLVHTPAGLTGATDELVGLVDLAPTLLELAGLAPAADMQGRSLAPLTRGQLLDNSREDVLFDNGRFFSLRARDFAAIDGPDGFSLFDLASDPGQQVNLMQDPTWAARLPELVERMLATSEEMAPLRKQLAAIPGTVQLSTQEVNDLGDIGYAGD